MLKKANQKHKNNNVLDKNKKHNVLGNIDYILNLCVNVPIFQLQIYVYGSSRILRNVDPDLKFLYWSNFGFDVWYQPKVESLFYLKLKLPYVVH